ncbi:MAG: hypothetical protein JNG86_03595, partial [Verrucomicrobiaceae bacterium]|nr:hypothetical protein [Verrucomicrobiaceae bacterium]
TLRVHDDIRVDASRRPVSDFPPITTALLPAAGSDEGKAFHLGISGQAWQPLDWRGAREDKSWKNPLPDGLEAAWLKDDNARLIDWLQGGADPMPQLARTQPAFAVLVLFGKKALLSGQIAEPALHAQLIAALRQTYTPGIIIDTDAFVVRGHCEASAEITHAAKSLPPHAQAPLIAIAHPGETWTILPATRDLLEPGALGKSGRLPAGIPPNLIEEAAATALEELRLHLLPKS